MYSQNPAEPIKTFLQTRISDFIGRIRSRMIIAMQACRDGTHWNTALKKSFRV
jgi:hypothetical protein